MQFLVEFGKIVCWRPPPKGWPPPTRNPGSAPALGPVFTGRKEVVAKVMFLLVSVILLTPQEDGYCCGRYASYWNAF